MAAGSKRDLLRHALATIAYRGGKAVTGAPVEFAEFDGGGKTPAAILSHIGDLMDWSLALSDGSRKWQESQPMPWNEQRARFFTALKKLDDYLASTQPLQAPEDKLLQGPIGDALTHIGQLAMLRRMAGCPCSGENYFAADIQTGRVGEDQAAPKRVF
jgi:hypothetical protein